MDSDDLLDRVAKAVKESARLRQTLKRLQKVSLYGVKLHFNHISSTQASATRSQARLDLVTRSLTAPPDARALALRSMGWRLVRQRMTGIMSNLQTERENFIKADQDIGAGVEEDLIDEPRRVNVLAREA
jgi:hypothetical protein